MLLYLLFYLLWLYLLLSAVYLCRHHTAALSLSFWCCVASMVQAVAPFLGISEVTAEPRYTEPEQQRYNSRTEALALHTLVFVTATVLDFVFVCVYSVHHAGDTSCSHTCHSTYLVFPGCKTESLFWWTQICLSVCRRSLHFRTRSNVCIRSLQMIFLRRIRLLRTLYTETYHTTGQSLAI